MPCLVRLLEPDSQGVRLDYHDQAHLLDAVGRLWHSEAHKWTASSNLGAAGMESSIPHSIESLVQCKPNEHR